MDSNADPATGATSALNLTSEEANLTIDAGIRLRLHLIYIPSALR